MYIELDERNGRRIIERDVSLKKDAFNFIKQTQEKYLKILKDNIQREKRIKSEGLKQALWDRTDPYYISSDFIEMSVNAWLYKISNRKLTEDQIKRGEEILKEMENIHFGISLRNVGPGMKFSGDGYSLSTAIPGKNNLFTMTQRGAAFEIPTQLNIGAAYDFLFDIGRFTAAGNFTSNAFTKDQFTVGGEFSFKELVLLRVGYAYEDGIWDDISDPEKTNANKGLSAGLTVQIPLNKEKTKFIGIDYTYIPTSSFSSTNMFAVRIDL